MKLLQNTLNRFNPPSSRPLVVDLFAGGGGASQGIEAALGISVDIAINHDEKAILIHQLNHPNTQHFQEDIFEVDPLIVCKNRSVGLLWASPDCKHFSKAKGGAPKSKRVRSLAWVVVKWAKAVSPLVIILENVEEFKTWGPLDENGKPIASDKGKTFVRWKEQLRKLGYKIEYRELVASDYGVPTSRKRLFLVARCDHLPIVWPTITHGDYKKNRHLIPYRTARECIDWSLPCPSIFNRKRGLANTTLKRIAKGIHRHIVNGLINHDGEYSFLTECANSSSQRNFSLNEPLRTQCAEVKGGHFALVNAFIVKFYGNDQYGQSIDTPLHTNMTSNHFALVHAFLVKYYGNDQHGQSIDEPLHTITTKDRLALCIINIDGIPHQIADIGLRMLQPHELFKAQGFDDHYIIDANIHGRKLSKADKVRLCGNSVCPPIAQLLVELNYQLIQFSSALSTQRGMG